jgi:outer membrane receptor for ferrienterochelin and colicin
MYKKMLLMTTVFLLSMGTAAFAQYTKGEVYGTVTDQNGEALPGVVVTATSDALIGQRSAVTNEKGSYRFPLLPSGGFTLTFTFTGFRTAEVKGIQVTIGEKTQVNQTLEPSTLEEALVVTAERPMTDASTTDSKTVFDAEQLDSIPTLARDVADVAKFVPGVTGVRMDSVNGGEGGLPNIRGGGQEGNQYVVDGLSSRSTQGFGVGINQNFDSIDSLLVVSDPFSPEYGKALGGAINIVTKSGGNEFSGEAGYQFRDDSLEADREPVQASNTVTGFERKKFWANAGGYFVKDKLWFFVSYNQTEPTDKSAGATPRTIGAENMVFQDGSPATSDFIVQEFPDGATTSENKQIFAKLTFNISESQELSLSYLDRDFSGVQASGRPLAYGASANDSNRWRLNYNWIGDWGVLELKAGQQETDTLSAGVTDFGVAARQNVTISQAFGNRSRYDNTLTDREDYAAKFTGFLDTANFGSHEFSLGVEFEKFKTRWTRNVTGANELVFNDGFTDGAQYEFIYATTDEGQIIIDQSGTPIQIPSKLTQRRKAQDNNDVEGNGFFIQDRITYNNWTVMLGVRTDKSEVYNDVGTRVWEWSYSDFVSPRVSILYDLNSDEKHVFKFGYGIFKDTATTRVAEFFNERGGNAFREYLWVGPDSRTFTEAELADPNNWVFNLEQSAESSPFDTDPAGLDPNDNERFLLEYNWRINPTLAFTTRYVNGKSSGLLEDVQVLDNPGTPDVSPHFFLGNFNDKVRDFESFDFIFNGSVGKLLNYYVSLTFTDSTGTNPGNFENETLNNPGGSGNYVGVFGDGVQSDGSQFGDDWAALFSGLGGVGIGDEGWEGNLSDSVDTSLNFVGNWNLPWDLELVSTVQYVDGYFYTLKGFQGAYGGFFTFPEGRGSRSTDAAYWLDLSLARNFKFGNRHNLQLRVDAFNILDEQEAISVVEEDTIDFETPFARQNPRAFQFGVQYKF